MNDAHNYKMSDEDDYQVPSRRMSEDINYTRIKYKRRSSLDIWEDPNLQRSSKIINIPLYSLEELAKTETNLKRSLALSNLLQLS